MLLEGSVYSSLSPSCRGPFMSSLPGSWVIEGSAGMATVTQHCHTERLAAAIPRTVMGTPSLPTACEVGTKETETSHGGSKDCPLFRAPLGLCAVLLVPSWLQWQHLSWGLCSHPTCHYPCPQVAPFSHASPAWLPPGFRSLLRSHFQNPAPNLN